MNAEGDARLDFTPSQPGKLDAKLYFMCDSYFDADQKFDVGVRVEEAGNAMNSNTRIFMGACASTSICSPVEIASIHASNGTEEQRCSSRDCSRRL